MVEAVDQENKEQPNEEQPRSPELNKQAASESADKEASEKAAAEEVAREETPEEAAARAKAEAEQAAAAQRTDATTKVEKARDEAAAQRRKKLFKMRASVDMLVAARHVSIAAAATRYGIIGLGEAGLALCTAICSAKNAPVGVVSLCAAEEAAAAEQNQTAAPAPLRPRHDAAAELERVHGRLVRTCSTRQQVIDGAHVVIVDMPPAGAAEALKQLAFRPEQVVICLVPTLGLATLHAACAPLPPVHIVRALALPSIACLVSDADSHELHSYPAAFHRVAATMAGSLVRHRLVFCAAVVVEGVAAPLPPLASSLMTSIGALAIDVFDSHGWPGALAGRVRAGEVDSLVCSDLDTDVSKPLAMQGIWCADERRVVMPLPHADLCAMLMHNELPDIAAGTMAGDQEIAEGEVTAEADAGKATADAPAEAAAEIPAEAAAEAAAEAPAEVPAGAEVPDVVVPVAEPAAAEAEAPAAVVTTSTTEERVTARDALLPVFRRGLPPVLHAVEARGKRMRDYSWSSKAEFEEAILEFADDFIMPQLMKLPTQAPPSVRLLQLNCIDGLSALVREAAGARARALASVADAARAARSEFAPLRTEVGIKAAETAFESFEAAEAARISATSAKEWSRAAQASRMAASSAQAAAAAHRFPAIGSHVVIESKQPYQAPHIWEGEVVRHARTQNAFAVKLLNGTVRLAKPVSAGGGDKVVQVDAS